ncbi:MAG: hypothetical protein HYS12_13230 [Planctomycetes bacterium]|nr:hypothetical protein [Planctomycetota bacterium]
MTQTRWRIPAALLLSALVVGVSRGEEPAPAASPKKDCPVLTKLPYINGKAGDALLPGDGRLLSSQGRDDGVRASSSRADGSTLHASSARRGAHAAGGNVSLPPPAGAGAVVWDVCGHSTSAPGLRNLRR